MKSSLEIKGLKAEINGTEILHGLNLTVPKGEVHAIMGKNGSGKSTLAKVMAGHPDYQVTGGDVFLDGKTILGLDPDVRAREGLFLAFQYPTEIPGVSNMEFLKAALDHQHAARGQPAMNAAAFMKQVRSLAASLDLNPEFLKRGVNEGFSGGEKKRNEILQMLLLAPRLAVLDETDSGLDIDALQTVADGVNRFRAPDNAVLMITHYQRLLNHIVPDQVHVLAAGRIVRSGGRELAEMLEAQGYGWIDA